MKKLFCLFLCMIIAFSIVSVTCFATEETTEDVIMEDVATEEKTETIFTRLWEWILDNKETILSICGEVLLFVMMVKNWFKQKGMGKTLDSVKLTTNTTVTGQSAVVKKMDEMITEFNENKEISEKLEATEKRVESMAKTATTLTFCLFEMITMIHTQNRNLPQGTKDRVTQMFADCIKMVEGNEGFDALATGLKSYYNNIVTKENENDEENERTGA